MCASSGAFKCKVYPLYNLGLFRISFICQKPVTFAQSSRPRRGREYKTTLPLAIVIR